MAQETQSSDAPITDSEGYPPEPGAGSGHAHPNEVLYIKIAAVLFFITAAEVAVYYVESLEGMTLVAILLVMSVVKFALVAMFFMHLRFDSPIFRRLFIAGILLAIGVYMIVLTTLHVWD